MVLDKIFKMYNSQIRSDQIWGTIIALTFINEIKIPNKRNLKM